tara:strand:+ start:501 stop:1607 length:1107 start_codon:yes stop_codon:yes gene_type:complete
MENFTKKFQDLITKKNRNFSVDLDSSTVNEINKLVNLSSEKKFNLKSKKNLKSLDLSDLKKIDQNIRGIYQKKLVRILKPKIGKITKHILIDNELSDFRVGGQCKYKKVFKSSVNKEIKFKKVKNLKEYNLPLTDELLCFSTKPHQDLSHQGFRSTMSLIFYLQLTDHYNETCLMQYAEFKNKSGLLDFDSDKYYPNAIKKKISKKLKWNVPKSMKPGKIFVMDGITPHNSNSVSSIPRLAINVKIQPRSLNYMYKIFNLKKSFKNNLKFNFERLEDDLQQCVIFSNSLNFELAVLYCMQRKFDKAFETFNKFALSKFSKTKIEKIFAGALFRKTYETVTSNDVKNIYNKNIKYADLSCADSIIRTFK